MGLQYYLANHDSKEILELGKGVWFLLKDDPEYLLYREGLLQFFQEEILDQKPGQDREYWMEVLDLIWDFVRTANPDQLQIINDCGDDLYYLKCKKYRIVASRYYTVKNDEAYFRDLNRHLDPQYTHMYQDKNL